MSADFDQVMAQCSRGCFTGLLRVRTREGNGEVRFLSGIQDGIRFDSMEGDAALERLQSASDPEFEAISSLPPIDLSSSEPVPPEGRLSRYHAAQLMRYCESNSLTCALELEVDGRVLTARYRLGELLSVEPDSEHTSRLAEAKEGLYRFRLPRFELPANVQQRRSVPAAAPKAPAPKPAPAPAAAKPAPVAAAVKPAPLANPPAAPKPQPTAASLAETPLVAMKPVAIVTPQAGAVGSRPSPGKVPASPLPAAPAAPKVAASAARPPTEARPPAPPARSPAPAASPAAGSGVRREGPRIGPSAGTGQPARAPERAAAAPPAAQPPAPARPIEQRPAASAGARLPSAVAPTGAAPSSRPAAPRTPLPPVSPYAPPQAPASVPPSPPGAQAKPAQIHGLWADAVKPPPQSAPLELDGSVRPGGASKPLGRAEGLSSLAYTPTGVPAVSSARPRSSARYWIVAVALLVVAAAVVGWFAFRR